jgi:SPX domain protein involved in polyphosphate accumulation
MRGEVAQASSPAREPAASDLASLRAFNRFELKYLADHALVARLRSEVTARLESDRHGQGGSYPVWSCYYDTGDLRFYWEKIDGIRFRRKLRIRHYGNPQDLTASTPVWVEIKQRVNRVTQKRRARLAYRDALGVCTGREPAEHDESDAPVLEEVLRMTAEYRLRPTAVVGYQREAFHGRDADGGLRLTIDRRLRGRGENLDLSEDGANRLILRPDLAVVEVKVNERVPLWLTERVASLNMQVVRISKYCQGVEASGLAPRSIFHLPDGGRED